jgi:mannose-1-phosphate guanylyltransferase
MSGSHDPWVILLAGGNGARLRGRCVRGMRFDRPKQFCRVGSDRTLLQIAIARARRLSDASRILPVVCEAHRAWWEPEFACLPPENVLSQPANRGNGVAIFHALLQILRRDRNPVVVVLPSDHAVDDEDALSEAIHQAEHASRRWNGALTLLGMSPGHPEPEYGWIVPGAATADSTRAVEAFAEKPSLERARSLMERGAFWNTFIFTATAMGLLSQFDRARPDLIPLHPQSLVPGSSDTSALERCYSRMPEVDFGRDVLATHPRTLRVLPVPPCGWTDLGTPARIERWLDRHALAARAPLHLGRRIAERAAV